MATETYDVAVELQRDPRERDYDLYHAAQQFGVYQAFAHQEIDKIGHWTAWFAARKASGALLDEAVKLGLTDEQIEALRKVAAQVAYD